MSEKTNIPQIRFKGFNDVWEQCKLNDLGVSTSGTSIESEFSDEGVYNVISIGSYSEDSIYNDQGIKAIHSSKTENRVLDEGDLTMILNDKTQAGRILGRVLLIEKSSKYVYNQRTQRIQPYKNKFSSEFLYHLLNAPLVRNKIIKQSQGNTQIYVNWSAIKETEYFVPNLVEQEKLGQMFSKINDLITLHQRKHEKYTNIKKALLEKIFPQNGEKIPQIRFKGFTEAWEQCKLIDLGRIETGNTPSTLVKEYYSEEGMLWVTPTDINSNILFNTERKLSEKGIKVARVIPANSTLCTCIASIGKNAFLPVKCAFNQQINALTPYDNNDPYFIFTNSYHWSQTMKRGAGGLTFQIVNKTEFSNIETSVPNKEEQILISKLFFKIDNLITLHQRECEKLKNIKKSLLEKMFV